MYRACLSVTATLASCLILVTGCSQQHASPGAHKDTGDPDGPRSYTCKHIDAPITIDGRLDDRAWKSARWTDAFIDIQGTAKPAPRFRTRAKMCWDGDYWYIAAEMEEPHVWATLDQHDQVIFDDNDFEIFIDPDGDGSLYYEVEVNALGTIFDLFLVQTYENGGPALHDWNFTGMKHAIHVDGTLNDPSDEDRGWTVEFALPWRTLKTAAGVMCPPQAGDVWRANFSRVEWQVDVVDGKYVKVADTPEDNWVWSPQGVIDMHQPATWGYVEFAGK